MASIDDSRTGMRNPSSIADLIVKGAIALVTAAFFIGAYLQFQVTFWLALIAALAVYITLLMLHALMRRSERADALASEVSRLEVELARAKGDDGFPLPQRAGPGPVTARPATVQRPGLAGVPRHELKVPGTMTPGAAAPAPRGHEPPPLGSLSPAAAQAPAKPSGSEPDYWSFRPSKQPQPEAQPRRRPDMGLGSALKTSLPAQPVAPALSEREADLDDVQGMIKRLADELSLGDTPESSSGLERVQESEQLLRASADALHTTADTMRAATAKSRTPLAAVRREQRAGAPMPPPIAPGHTRLSAVAAAVAAGRINVALKSIIGLADHQVHHYEIVLSPRDETGAVMALAAHDPHLARTGLNPLIDAARLKRGSQICRSLADAGQKGCCVLSAASAESLGAERFLEEVATAYRQREELSGELVLSFGLADVKSFDVTEWSALTDMRDLGFRFALEDVTDVNYEFTALAAAGFTYIKMDAGRILEGLSGPRGLTSAADVCRSLSGLGFTVIIDGIDDEATRSAIIECGVTLGAGPLFGPARVIIGEPQPGSGTAAA